jgi:hypothetical protein
VQQMYQEYGPQGLMVLSPGWQEPQSNCQSWINTFGLTYEVLSDMSTTTSRLFVPNQGGSYYFPHDAIIDQHQILRYTETGFNQTAVENMIASLMEPDVAVDPLSLNFGSTIVGGVVNRTLHVDNTGTGILHVTNISSSNPSLFTANPSSGQVYAVDDLLEVTVTFHAQSEGTFSGTLHVVTDAGTVDVDLEAAVAGSGPFLWVEPLTVDFGAVQVGETVEETLWAYSYGQQAVNITSISVAHPDLTVSPTSANLASGDSLEVTLIYSPSSMGTVTDAIHFVSNGGNRDIDVTALGIQAILTSSLSDIDFGTVEVGGQQVVSFRFYNIGNIPLTISNYIVQTNIEQITVFVQSPGIAPGDSGNCFIRWMPQTSGTLEGSVTFESDGDDVVIGLHGEAEAAAVGDNEAAIPTRFALDQNFPNPFNGETMIPYALPRTAPVMIAIYNIYGRQVSTLDLGEQNAGWHQVSWNGTDSHGKPVATGIYFYRLLVDGRSLDLRKMLYLK